MRPPTFRKFVVAGLLLCPTMGVARITAPATTDRDAFCAGPRSAESCIDKSGNVLPTTDNLATSGTSALRWLGVYGVEFYGDGAYLTGIPSSGAIAGVYLPLAGGTMTGALNLFGGGTGALPYQSAANTSAFLSGGTTNYVLAMSGGRPQWAAAASSATNVAGGATGSLPYQTQANTTALLAAGTTNYVLSMSGGLPAWTAAASSATNVVGGAAGSLPYQSAANTTALLAAGTSNQVLVGSPSAPSWTATPSLSGVTFSAGGHLDGSPLILNGTSLQSTLMHGTTSNDSAPSGFVGEYLQCHDANPTAFAATGVWSDVCSISPTAGDWDIVLSGAFQKGSATSVTQVLFCISSTSGNSAAGCTQIGEDYLQYNASADLSNTIWDAAIPRKRVSINATTTYYLKTNATYATAAPNFFGVMSARRVR